MNVVIEMRNKVLLVVSRKCNIVAWTTELFGVKSCLELKPLSSYHQNMVLNISSVGSRLYVGFGNASHLATPIRGFKHGYIAISCGQSIVVSSLFPSR